VHRVEQLHEALLRNGDLATTAGTLSESIAELSHLVYTSKLITYMRSAAPILGSMSHMRVG